MRTDAQIVENRLRPLVTGRKVVGLAAAVVRSSAPPLFQTYGESSSGTGRQIEISSVFEIGSVTKVFTGILLADMAVRGKVGLGDTLERLLPPGTEFRRRGMAGVTLLNLATHTSGLPRLPSNLLLQALLHRSDPYARYTTEDLHRAAARARFKSREFRYSNFGYGLLGHLLSRVGAESYDALVTERICKIIGMEETRVGPTGFRPEQRAQGHGRRGKSVPFWDIPPAMAGAGALRSTVSDLARFLQAHLTPREHPLWRALEMALQEHYTVRPGSFGIGLGWLLLPRHGRTLAWHNGGTGGFGSFLALDRDSEVGFVLLYNSRHLKLLDRVSFELLEELRSPTELGRKTHQQ
ncbi:MAG: class A beta-lactamase-related serine hydrolase [Acidobacteria bacterium]|nr:MAG: class A beta-lactamase-related serine hydrolase [Acidobacteriota bacterium]